MAHLLPNLRQRLSVRRPLPFEAMPWCYVAITTSVMIVWASKSKEQRKPDCKAMLNTFLSPSSGLVDDKVYWTPSSGRSRLALTGQVLNWRLSSRSRSLIGVCTIHQKDDCPSWIEDAGVRRGNGQGVRLRLGETARHVPPVTRNHTISHLHFMLEIPNSHWWRTSSVRVW